LKWAGDGDGVVCSCQASIMNDEDDELQLALEESARIHSSTFKTLFFTTNHSISRSQFDAIPDKLLPSTTRQSDQKIHKVDLFNQFHRHWKTMIRKYNGPSAICGYTSLALAVHILKRDITFDSLDDVVQFRKHLQVDPSEFSKITEEVEMAMKFIHDDRQQYILNHKSEFRSKADEKRYIMNWVANYEISDYLIHVLERDGAEESSRGIPVEKKIGMVFFRFNEYPEIEAATHEERRRIEKEMKIFGGKQGEKAGTLSYGEGEHMFVIERFCPRRLLSPDLAMREADAWRVGVVDLNGHFCAVVPTRKDGVVLLDTTQNDYLQICIVAMIHEMYVVSSHQN
jgi:hypothetical protein